MIMLLDCDTRMNIKFSPSLAPAKAHSQWKRKIHELEMAVNMSCMIISGIMF